MNKIKFILIFSLFSFLVISPVFGQTKDLLSAEENLWLKSRNNTIVVYPEQNSPPYSYQSASGNLQGLSIDYLELISDKIGVKIQYLTPRSRSQIETDIQTGKGDVVGFSMPDKDREKYLIFTESYITVPVVIVVRKDYEKRSGLTLNDFNGKRVSMIDTSAIEVYVHKNYPRVVIEKVTDDEVSLQQIVLGEVDAGVMDVASLSYYLSKQVLSSVKVAGNTGLDYKPAFALLKDKTILQSILEKGLSQISTNDRSLLVDKWIALPGETKKDSSFFIIIKDNLGIATLYILFGIGILTILFLLLRHKSLGGRYFRKVHKINELKAEVEQLEGESSMLAQELKEVKTEEDRLQEEIRSLKE
ncbi:MAG: transporter substrate-binding domain-containing protein [Candidatus Paceibacterota bacterium]